MAFLLPIMTLLSLAVGSANLAHTIFPEHRPFIIEKGVDGTYHHKFVPDAPYFSDLYKKQKEQQKYGYPNLKDPSKTKEVIPSTKPPLIPNITDYIFRPKAPVLSKDLPPPPPITKKPKFVPQPPIFSKPHAPNLKDRPPLTIRPELESLTNKPKSHVVDIALFAIAVSVSAASVYLVIRNKKK